MPADVADAGSGGIHMVFDFIRKLFSSDSGGGGQVHQGDPQEYNGYTIQPAPQKDPAGWRVRGVISREVEGEAKTHTFVRADTYSDLDTIITMTVTKAKRIIDEQGDRIFNA